MSWLLLRDWMKKTFRLSIVELTNESNIDFMFEIDIDLKRYTFTFDDKIDEKWLFDVNVMKKKTNARIFSKN